LKILALTYSIIHGKGAASQAKQLYSVVTLFLPWQCTAGYASIDHFDATQLSHVDLSPFAWLSATASIRVECHCLGILLHFDTNHTNGKNSLTSDFDVVESA
jgi:hypothetical protein